MRCGRKIMGYGRTKISAFGEEGRGWGGISVGRRRGETKKNFETEKSNARVDKKTPGIHSQYIRTRYQRLEICGCCEFVLWNLLVGNLFVGNLLELFGILLGILL